MELKRIKFDAPEYDGLDAVKTIMDRMSDDLNRQLNDVFVEALKIKGYKFKSTYEMFRFIESFCVCHYYSKEKRKVFFVKEQPFLAIYDEPRIDFKPYSLNSEYKVAAILGRYSFL